MPESGSEEAGQNLQQRRLADPVGADDAEAGLGAEGDRHAIEHGAATAFEGDVTGDQRRQRRERKGGWHEESPEPRVDEQEKGGAEGAQGGHRAAAGRRQNRRTVAGINARRQRSQQGPVASTGPRTPTGTPPGLVLPRRSTWAFPGIPSNLTGPCSFAGPSCGPSATTPLLVMTSRGARTMPIAITDDHQELASTVRGVLTAHKALQAARALLESDDEPRPSYWGEMADLGWLGIHLPEEYGGSGGGLLELVVVLDELGRQVAPGPFLPTVLASAVIDQCGTRRAEAAPAPRLWPTAPTTAALGLAGPGLALANGILAGEAGVVLGGSAADLFLFVVGDDVVIVQADAPGSRWIVPATSTPRDAASPLTADGVARAGPRT